MRSVSIAVVVVGGLFMLLVAGWVAARLTGAVQVYRTQGVSNLPTMRPGEVFMTSNLVQPKRLDFIAYERQDYPAPTRTTFFHRLAGLPGDTVTIRHGRLLVNGRHLDAGLPLMHTYTLDGTALAHLPADLVLDSSNIDRTTVPDSVRLNLADDEVTRRRLPARRLILAAAAPDRYMRERRPEPWNQDYFGLVVVPAGHYFVLGDNRHNALDSRYAGFIPQADFRGTILGQR